MAEYGRLFAVGELTVDECADPFAMLCVRGHTMLHDVKCFLIPRASSLLQ